MNIDKRQLTKSLLTILGVFLIVFIMTQASHRHSYTLSEYASTHPDLQKELPTVSDGDNEKELSDNSTVKTSNDKKEGKNLQERISETESLLIGAKLNGKTEIANRITYADSFYFEPLSDDLKRYITGVSYPQNQVETDGVLSENQSDNLASNEYDSANCTEITYDDLVYMHIQHFDFEGNDAAGELICNKAIAEDLVEIFYELYKNEYQIEKVHLIDEYNGDDEASMADNNSSCFNYRTIAGTTTISKHAYGLAIDINPLYNPYVTYNGNGGLNAAPKGSEAYIDRNNAFPYKIDENDLCYKLFIAHGFTWGGNWNSSKDYQHFQKTK